MRVLEADLRGGQGCIDHQQRIIWLDPKMSPAARRSTLAYEVALLEYGPTPADARLAAAHQRAAADWAALMLIPTEDLLFALSLTHDLAEVAAFLGVDTPTVRARLRGLTDEEQDEWMRVMQPA